MSRGYAPTIVVSCVMCAWHSRSADKPWSRHAGVVHTQMLRPGHVVFERTPVHTIGGPDA